MKVIQQNLSRNLERVPQIIESIMLHRPDVIFLEEFCYPLQKDSIIAVLENEGYTITLPVGFSDEAKTNDKWNACCMLAWCHNTTCFSQTERSGVIQKYRYIEGTLVDRHSKASVHCFWGYAQQCFSDAPWMIERKANMLNAIGQFCADHRHEAFYFGGDLTTDFTSPTAKCRDLLQRILERPYVKNTYIGPTWNNEQLDYAVISTKLDADFKHKTIPIKETGSDHIALLTEIVPKE